MIPETRNKSVSQLETLFVKKLEKETLCERGPEKETHVQEYPTPKDGV